LDSVFETFTNLYGLSINKDINKLNRIEGASIDIGAYEQQTGQIITYPPSPPILNAE
jgi:hypothetical protein